MVYLWPSKILWEVYFRLIKKKMKIQSKSHKKRCSFVLCLLRNRQTLDIGGRHAGSPLLHNLSSLKQYTLFTLHFVSHLIHFSHIRQPARPNPLFASIKCRRQPHLSKLDQKLLNFKFSLPYLDSAWKKCIQMRTNKCCICVVVLQIVLLLKKRKSWNWVY